MDEEKNDSSAGIELQNVLIVQSESNEFVEEPTSTERRTVEKEILIEDKPVQVHPKKEKRNVDKMDITAKNFVLSEKLIVWIFLFLVSFATGFIAFSHEMIIGYLLRGRLFLISLAPSSFALQLLLWVSTAVALVAFSMLLTLFFAPTAEGSGIPAVKAIINGAPLVDPISLPTLIVKVICLPLCLGASMFLGKVGPTTHIGACVTASLMRLKPFRKLHKNQHLRIQLIACGAGCGVGGTFGSPTGGVLFALEIFGTYYSIRTYQKSFYVGLIAAFTYRLLAAATVPSITITTAWNVVYGLSALFTMPDVIFGCILGAFMGFAGALFVWCNQKILLLRDTIGQRKFLAFKIEKWKTNKFFMLTENRFLFTIVMTVITALVTFPRMIGVFMSLSPAKTVEDLFRGTPLTAETANAGDWSDPNNPATLFINLLIFNVLRSVISLFSISLPIPGGLYVPLLIMGAGWGRLYGEVLTFLIHHGWGAGSPEALTPGAYAVIGAATMTAGATHAFSTCFIISEIIGTQFHLPTLLATLIAIRVSRIFKENIYDSIIAIRKWPAIVESKTYIVTSPVRKVYKPAIYLTQLCSLRSLREFTASQEFGPTIQTYPVVQDDETKLFVGSISYDDVIALKNKHEENQDNDTMITIPNKTFPHLLGEETSVLTAHMSFSMFGLDRTFIVRNNKLVGAVTRKDLAVLQHDDPDSKLWGT